MTTTLESLGPAERILQTLLTYTDHAYHGRPGIVSPDPSSPVGVKWEPVTHRVEGDAKVVYRISKKQRERLGVLAEDGTRSAGYPERVMENGRQVGIFRPSGLFPEVVAWIYQQIAEVWKLDNEFAARWASFAFGQDHRDLKVILAAFMLVQSRAGLPIMDEGVVLLHDSDFRSVGEAMMLLRRNGKDLDPKLLLRIHDVLSLPAVAEINRRLGFGRSARRPFLGRWTQAVEKWLHYRDINPKALEALVKAGFRTQVMALCRRVGYKPESATFFQTLRWKQVQAEDGRRTLAIGQAVRDPESWERLSETKICQAIGTERPSWKRIMGLLGKKEVTRAIMTAAIEAGCMSDKDLIIMTPTLEALGLLDVQVVRERHDRALRSAEDQRAINIAKNVRSTETKEKLQAAAEKAAQKAVETAMRDMRLYFFIDISGSMTRAIPEAKKYLTQLLPAFPPDRIHIAVFNTVGREIQVRHASAKGVEAAFTGIQANGGTSYASGVRALCGRKPKDGEDVLFFFVGDEEEPGSFENEVRSSGLRPTAFALVKLGSPSHSIVRTTAQRLSIPCFQVDEKTFADTYTVPRTLQNLIAATPVQAPSVGSVTSVRKSLVEQILSTELLQRPAWAA